MAEKTRSDRTASEFRIVRRIIRRNGLVVPVRLLKQTCGRVRETMNETELAEGDYVELWP